MSGSGSRTPVGRLGRLRYSNDACPLRVYVVASGRHDPFDEGTIRLSGPILITGGQGSVEDHLLLSRLESGEDERQTVAAFPVLRLASSNVSWHDRAIEVHSNPRWPMGLVLLIA